MPRKWQRARAAAASAPIPANRWAIIPSLGGVALKNGRYGAYVTAGGVNATIPSDIAPPETITLAQAIALIDERAAKGGGKPKRGAKKAAPAKEGEA